MKKTMWFALCVLFAVALSVSAKDLTIEEQTEIILRYMYVTGQTPNPPASMVDSETGKPLPVKCGTPAVLDYYFNRERLDRRLTAALGVQDESRRVRHLSYGVPGGNTLIHYDTAGVNAPWQVNVDSDGDGVPNYIESLALIADSCYVHEVQTLGLRRPLNDEGCVDGVDERIDIYISALQYGQYGTTYSQAACPETSTQHLAAWIELDHDFQLIDEYVGRPLDAARVTLAHEIFHAIQFAIDVTEGLNIDLETQHYSWMEMSSVWMEEEIYDDLNDYYLFDEIFFHNPQAGIQNESIPFHMYEAVFWPIYLSETYGRDVMKAIWMKAEELGVGPDYFQATNEVVDSASQEPEHALYKCNCYHPESGACLDSTLIHKDLASAMAEFAVWNFFTGPYAAQAPNGIGYSEGANYAYIPLDSIQVIRDYNWGGFGETAKPPQTNGTAYIRFENLQSIDFDTLLLVHIQPDDETIVRWGVSGIFQMEADPDSHVVVTDVIDAWETWSCLDSVCDSTVGGDCVHWACSDSALFGGRFIGDMLGEWVCTFGEFGSDLPCGPSDCHDSTRVIDLRPYRSITLVMTPSTPNLMSDNVTVSVEFAVFDSSVVNQALVNLSPAVLTPYPNPAVVSEMDGEDLSFRFQVTTDSISFASMDNPILQLDIYTVAGELVRTVEVEFQDGTDRYGARPGGGYEIGWDMKNAAGKDVASGAYLAVARLFDGSRKKTQVVEKQVKVAVIR